MSSKASNDDVVRGLNDLGNFDFKSISIMYWKTRYDVRIRLAA